jgi:hypothetical protein
MPGGWRGVKKRRKEDKKVRKKLMAHSSRHRRQKTEDRGQRKEGEMLGR